LFEKLRESANFHIAVQSSESLKRFDGYD